MRVLLDECLPRKLKRSIIGHDVATVQERGWSSKKNGELLGLMDGTVDVFLTSDQNLCYQQNLTAIKFSIIVLVAPLNGRPFGCLHIDQRYAWVAARFADEPTGMECKPVPDSILLRIFSRNRTRERNVAIRRPID